MKTIQISDETYEFLRKLAQEISTQDNRATAKPYFYVIERERWRVAHDEFHSGHTKNVWVDTSGEDEHREWSSRQEYIEDLIERYDFTQESAEIKAEECLQEFVMERYFEEENVFLTQAAFEEHVRVNGHNLGRHGKGYHSYLKHAFRNAEMASLFTAIAEIGNAEVQP